MESEPVVILFVRIFACQVNLKLIKMTKFSRFASSCKEKLTNQMSRARTAVQRLMSRSQARRNTPDEEREEALKDLAGQLAFVLPTNVYPLPLHFGDTDPNDNDTASMEVAPPTTPRNISACSLFSREFKWDTSPCKYDYGYLEGFSDTDSLISFTDSINGLCSPHHGFDDWTWNQIAPDDTNSDVSSLGISTRAASTASLEFNFNWWTPSDGGKDVNKACGLPHGASDTNLTKGASAHLNSGRKTVHQDHPSLNILQYLDESRIKQRRPLSPVVRKVAPPQQAARPLFPAPTPLPGAVQDFGSESPVLCF